VIFIDSNVAVHVTRREHPLQAPARRQLALSRYEDLRRRVMPFAEARGYLVDDDVIRDVS